MTYISNDLKTIGKWLCASLLVLFLTTSLGCSNRKQALPDTSPDTAAKAAADAESAAAETGPWFCQAAPGGASESWECLNNPERVNNPAPDRLPADAPAADELEPLSRNPSAPPQARRSRVRPPASPAAPPTANYTAQPKKQSARARKKEPKYVRLAYQPEKPVSLLDLPPDFVAVQLTALSDRERVETFVSENHLGGLSAAMVAAGEEIRYVLLLGIYESAQLAADAITDLPGPLAQFKPWVRPLQSLQQAMLAADRLMRTQNATPASP